MAEEQKVENNSKFRTTDLTAQKQPIQAPIEPVKAPEPAPIVPIEATAPVKQDITPVVKPVEKPTSITTDLTAQKKQTVAPQPVKNTQAIPKAPEPIEPTPKEKLEFQQAEKQVKTQDQQAKIEGFNALMEWGADGLTVAKYIQKNKDVADDLKLQFNQYYKTKANYSYQQKYQTASPEALYQAHLNSDIVIWDDKYNQLPTETKQAFEQYKRTQDILQTKEELAYSLQNDMLKIIQASALATPPVYAGASLKDEYDRLTSWPEITSKRTELEGLSNELWTLKNDIENIEDDVIAEYEGSGRSEAFVYAKIQEAQRLKTKEYNNLSVQYQNGLASYSDMKADIDREMEYIEIEEWREFQLYQTQLSQYNADRSRADTYSLYAMWEQSKLDDRAYAEERAAFEQKNQELAVQKQNEFQKEILKINQDFAIAQKEPTYMTDRDGNLIAVTKWGAEKVMDSAGEVVAITKTKDYTDNVSYNADMWQYVTTRVYEDSGKTPDFFVSDINGNSSTNLAVFDAISWVPSTWKHPDGWVWCGEWVNKYLANAWVKWIRVGDSYASKEKYINNAAPQVWWLAVWNPNPQGKNGEYWHIWVVTWYNQQTNKVEITDWNKNGDGKKNTYEISVSQINNSDWGFVHVEWPQAEKATWFSQTVQEWGDNILNGVEGASLTAIQDTKLREQVNSYINAKNKEEAAKPVGDITETDIKAFNSLTDSEKLKQKDSPLYQKFVQEKQKVMDDPNADIYDIIKYSGWGKDLNATQSESITKFSQALNSIGEIQETITKWDGTLGFGDKTWPIVWFLRSNNPYDVTAQQLKAQITSLIPNLARWVYGEVWVLTEQDVALYRQTVPNLTATEDVNNAILWMTLRLVRNWLKENLQDSARAWFDTSLFAWKIKRIDDQVNQIESQLRGATWKATWKKSFYEVVNEWINMSSYDNYIP